VYMPKFFKRFFTVPETKDHRPRLDADYRPGLMSVAESMYDALGLKPTVSEETHRRNMELIELARMEQEREITNNNLKAQHKVLIITTVATFVALLSSVSAVYIALHQYRPKPPVVNVSPSQPDIKVYLPATTDEKSTNP
jgi:hypothetical protein